MTSTLVLRSAINVDKYKNHSRSPITQNTERELEYAQGITKFFSLVSYENFNSIMLVDNTICSTQAYPETLRRLLPEYCEVIATRTNRFGRYNKGAGDLETYRYLFKNKKIKTEYIVHFEPRLQLSNAKIFHQFFNLQKSLLSLSPDKLGIQTGYMILEAIQLKTFCNISRLLKMVLRNESIEKHMLSFAKSQNIEILEDYHCSLRIDPVSRRLIDY